jgi:MYXO-CTERM domain-containing protein
MTRKVRFAPLALALCLAGGNAAAGGPASAYHARGALGVFWFMHISDLHIGASFIEGPNATEHLQTALNDAVVVIKPRFVAATGDLCDASIAGIPTTGQTQGEWDTYKQAYTNAGMTPSFYHDLPGNHDGYGDTGLTYYLANSLNGVTNHATSSTWQVTTPLGDYFFYGLDSAGNGSGPFVEKPHLPDDQLAALTTGLTGNTNAQLNFVLMHHMLDQPDNGQQLVDAIQNNGGAYFIHGHVHEYSEYLAGDGSIVANEVSSLGKMDTQNVAVGVVDHNGFVYRATDITALWPMVMITAPMRTTLRGGTEINPYAYYVCKDRPDNPFRAAVFSPAPPTEVTLTIEGLAPVPMALVPGSDGIYEAEVDTTSLQNTTLDVTVSATAGGVTRTDTIDVVFATGPCSVLPGTVAQGGAGGGGAGGSTGGTGGATTGTGGAITGGTGGATTTSGGAGGATSTGGGGAAGGPSTDPQSNGGCGCTVAGDPGASLGIFPALGALALLARRRFPRARRAAIMRG